MSTAPSDAAESVRIAVLGAGMSGLCMGTQLKQRGIHDFVILEKADSVGGTWRENTYPGIACDVPSHLYSFSFELNPNWSHNYGNGDEIWQYPPAQGGEQIFSGCCSTATRLPNGNTQLVISASGRVIEVTPDHEIVWEFINPHRAGTKIAQIFDAQRMREDFPLDWTRP